MRDLNNGECLGVMNELKNKIKKEIKRRNARKDSLILEAMSFVYGQNFNIEDFIGRGHIVYYAEGSSQFKMDGKVLLEFHEINDKIIFYREYMKIKNEFNECLPIDCVVNSEIL